MGRRVEAGKEEKEEEVVVVEEEEEGKKALHAGVPVVG